MHKIAKQSMVLLVISTLIFIPFNSSALAKDPLKHDDICAGMMVADFLLVRPLGIAATIVGTALFIASLPFSALGGNTQTACRKMVVEPAKHAFKRPLGDF